MKFLGWLLGFGGEGVTSISEVEPSLAAPWAQENSFWVLLGGVALVVAAIVFYFRFQPKGSPLARFGLAASRGLLLAVLFITLADPVLRLRLVNEQKPYVYVVFDGTDSMAIEDELPDAQRKALVEATGLKETTPKPEPEAKKKSSKTGPAAVSTGQPTRLDYIKALLNKNDNVLAKLQDGRKVQLEAFLFDGNTTSQLRKLTLNSSGTDKLDSKHLAEQLTTKGQVTALGSVVSEVGQQFGSGRLAGVVVFSDFAQNSGIAPLGSNENSPVSRLGVPIYAVGVGVTEAVDLSVDLQTDPKMKKAERSSVLVKLRQSGLQGRSVTVTVMARKLGGEGPGETPAEIKVGEKTVTLQSSVETAELPFTPEESGRFEFTATVDKVEGEIVDQNNRATREVNIIDDYLRLMYVAYEPTWEWRFIKEVFHRDKLVGMQGFRTFLGSSDPRVREANVLFLSTLTPKRSEFFANDVIFLDDMPRANLNDRFCEMVKEYVGNLGGGLVVIAGPRYGPKEIYQTPLADMLPVIIDPNAELRTAPERPEFRLRLTSHASEYSSYPFMRLGQSDTENSKAWDNLGKLPWYQPVAALHEQAFALAEHPTDKCADGKTPQPIIAVRRYGNGQVVYIGQNEMWRLRRKYGEKYYRQFWSQLIYHLGMSHVLGADKRFVVKLGSLSQKYQAEDKVTLTVEAYDENYEPLTDEKLASHTLAAELVKPGTAGNETTPLTIPMLRKGVFELRIPVFTAGEYTLRVKDPVTNKFHEQRFEVLPLSAERRRGVRDEKLQTEIAQQSGGRSYDLTTVSNLLNDIHAEPKREALTRNHALWTTPLWFTLVMALMLGEWLSRKMLKLS